MQAEPDGFELVRSKTAENPSGSAALQKALLSVGTDKSSAEKLVSAGVLQDVVIPLFWKDGLVSNARSLWMIKLTDVLKEFEKEFPDGQVRWDHDYESD